MFQLFTDATKTTNFLVATTYYIFYRVIYEENSQTYLPFII